MEGIVLFALHLLGDFPLQNKWMATEKLGGGKAWFAHLGVHFCLYMVVLVWLYGSPAFLAAMFLTGLHGAIDWRRWDYFDSEGFDAYSLWVDQSLHVASIALTVVWFG